MKSLWRKTAYISAWVILALGLVGAIVGAATYNSFTTFCNIFIPAAFYFVILMVYLEHTNNVEMRMDQTYRKENGLPQIPESSYTNMPNFSAPAAPAPYQPAQPQFQQPVQFQQPAPAPVQQPAPVQPAPVQPAPVQPVPTPTPAPVPTPAPAAVEQPWTCSKCGTTNNASANFCKGCGNKKD